MKSTILFYFAIFGCVICASSAANENADNSESIDSIPASVSQKLDYLSGRIDNNENEMNKLKTDMAIIKNNTDKITKLLAQLLRAESGRKEMNGSANENDVMKQFSSLFDSKVKPMMNEISNQLKETLEKQISASADEIDAMKEMPLRFSSLCESKVKPIVSHVNDMNDRLRQTLDKGKMCDDKVSRVKDQLDRVKDQLDRVESQLDQQKARNACEPNLCVYGGSCVSILGGTDFLCDKCPIFRSGMRCENFDCRQENLCWVRGNTLYAVLEPQSNWTTAKRKCQSEGMRLIMPKEKDQSEFIVDKLRAVYGSVGIPYFWMGIKREGGSEWKWLDGSELDYYTGGSSSFKSATGNLFGHLYLSGADVKWARADVTYSNVYPLCEKRV